MKAGPRGPHVLVVEVFRWASDADAFNKHEKAIEMRFDGNTQRFFLHARDGSEISEAEAPEYFLGGARGIFKELLKARDETRRI